MITLFQIMLLFLFPYAGDEPYIPPIEDMCLSVTSYWPWDDDGQLYDGYHGQCDADCSYTGGGYYLPEQASNYPGGYAACIYDWTSRKGYSTRVVNVLGEEWYCVDNFGVESHWEPFFSLAYLDWVVPVDLLAPEGHGLYCDWSVSWGEPYVIQEDIVAVMN